MPEDKMEKEKATKDNGETQDSNAHKPPRAALDKRGTSADLAASGESVARGSADDVKNVDEVALELMKFVAVTTGYGKGTPTAGFTGKGQRSSEEYAESLLELFERCRTVVAKGK